MDDEQCKVARYAYVSCKVGRYSVPCQHAGREVGVPDHGPAVEIGDSTKRIRDLRERKQERFDNLCRLQTSVIETWLEMAGTPTMEINPRSQDVAGVIAPNVHQPQGQERSKVEWRKWNSVIY